MVIGILCIIGGLLLIVIGGIADSVPTIDKQPLEFDSDKEFWDFHLKLSGIADPAERRKFEREYKLKKRNEKASHK